MGIALKRLGVQIDRVLASPFVRAQETAELVVATARLPVKVRTLDALKPNATSDALWAALSGAGGEGVLAVGHLPSIASLAASLLGSMAEQPLWFHKSSLAAVHCEARGNNKLHARLEWMISPAMAKHLPGRQASAGPSARQVTGSRP